MSGDKKRNELDELRPINHPDGFFKLENHTNKRGIIIYKFSTAAKGELMSWIADNYFPRSKFVPPKENNKNKGSYGWHIILATGKTNKNDEDKNLFYHSVKKECASILSVLQSTFTRKFKKHFLCSKSNM